MDLFNKTKTLSIIGTAGRAEDGPKLTKDHWTRMIDAALTVIEREKPTALVSGGAAWADHVAVHIHQAIGIPTSIIIPKNPDDIQTTLAYHERFSMKINGNVNGTWTEVLDLQPKMFGRFKQRNSVVADAADLYLAMTFGNGPNIKDGGTLDTVNKMRSNDIKGYHFDLNNFTLHEC